jgi:hypothetical protein
VQKFEESVPVIKAESLPLKAARVATPDPVAAPEVEEVAAPVEEKHDKHDKKKKSIFGK